MEFVESQQDTDGSDRLHKELNDRVAAAGRDRDAIKVRSSSMGDKTLHKVLHAVGPRLSVTPEPAR
ncbi:MAG: hypothetical protein Q7T63_06670 [Burkholderiaceae bacterium]|nr:hypothetical protein [Burkholderiaceae bacterium]